MGGLIEIGGVEVGLINVVAVAWFVLAGLSTAYVVWDSFANKNPEATVMKWGWGKIRRQAYGLLEMKGSNI